MIVRKRIFITGRVQGVGFRPAVYRLATELGLTGAVLNDTRGVTIELQGEAETIDEFLARILSEPDKPPMARISSCGSESVVPMADEEAFAILRSDSQGTPLSQVTGDIATCPDCLAEMNDPADFRYHYPFINCTNCGPRYSIVRHIPYDRPNTTMSQFTMCARCGGQYGDPADRRFHAQPVACSQCGPRIRMTDANGTVTCEGTDEVLSETARLLKAGKIVAIKGIGGFHLAVNAFDDVAVRRLRRRKRRDHKPFAMMAASIETITEHAEVDSTAAELLTSPQSPIVLLARKAGSRIAPSVAEGVATYGFMLCYAPLHHMLFAQGPDVLVMTSANISDEPLICRNDLALQRLGDVADAFLMHDRDIYRQVDDSIVHFIDEQPALLRRARGYVPTPILTSEPTPQDIFAAGADLKNTFCFAKANQLIPSEHIGDLEDAEVYHHYIASIEHLRRLFEVEPKVVVCDLHPGYFSTRYAESLGATKVIRVQHHWAHIASVLAEHDLAGPVIGIECDGTGYGTDGAIWGCECMIASLGEFRRFGRLAYFPLAGGDKASKEAIRPTLGLLAGAFGDQFALGRYGWLLDRIEPDRAQQETILAQIQKGFNVVSTSSLGRVFDAVAAMLGLGVRNHFDAQLPMALEAVAAPDVDDRYGFDLHRPGSQPVQLELGGMLESLLKDLRTGRSEQVISARFHNTIAAGLAAMAKAAREDSKLDVVALSGGVFCNRYLANHLIALLKQAGFSVLCNRIVPANDGGLSVGQAAIAASILRSQR